MCKVYDVTFQRHLQPVEQCREDLFEELEAVIWEPVSSSHLIKELSNWEPKP